MSRKLRCLLPSPLSPKRVQFFSNPFNLDPHRVYIAISLVGKGLWNLPEHPEAEPVFLTLEWWMNCRIAIAALVGSAFQPHTRQNLWKCPLSGLPWVKVGGGWEPQTRDRCLWRQKAIEMKQKDWHDTPQSTPDIKVNHDSNPRFQASCSEQLVWEARTGFQVLQICFDRVHHDHACACVCVCAPWSHRDSLGLCWLCF